MSAATKPMEDDDNNGNGNSLDMDMLTAPSIILSKSANASFSPYTVSLYVLRQSDPGDNWKIQAQFNNQLKYTFKSIANLNSSEVSLLDLLENEGFCPGGKNDSDISSHSELFSFKGS
jgi:hypothetical protein